MKKKLKKFLPIILLMSALAGGWYFVQGKSHQINISNQNGQSSPSTSPSVPKSPISGLACENANRRPVAVMLAGDAVARPLSGLAQAEMVFNMPVFSDSITRLMAVFVCQSPKEIGSIRSARHDYIALAKGLDAIYAHWGGSHFALDKLNAGVIDNLDALKNPSEAFYRKSGVASPHNGFTSFNRLWTAAQNLKYRLENKFIGYEHQNDESDTAALPVKTLSINFSGASAVKYVYDPAGNFYRRWRGGYKEIDRNTNQQVAAKNVVIMRAPSRQIEGQYNDVQVEGEGQAMVYQNGQEIAATWKKSAADQTSKLYFYDQEGQEIKFVPGQIWVEVVDPSQTVIWQ